MCGISSIGVIGLTFMFIEAGNLYAQQPPARPIGRPPAGPVVSPYLNLVRRSGSPAINYYGIVRPQQQFYREVQRLEADLSTQRSEVRALEEESGLPVTGHAAHFMNYSHFYSFREGAGGGAGVHLADDGVRRSGGARAGGGRRAG